MGEIIGIAVTDRLNTQYVVGESLDLSGNQVAYVDEYGAYFDLDAEDLIVSECDMSTVGIKNVTVSCGGYSVTFQIYVHADRIDQVLDPATYPESEHDYGENMDEIQTITYPGASSLTLVFSDDTYTESGWDYIYVYDQGDNEIACYTGRQAAGVTLTVPGDTAKIRLTSDYSSCLYGYSFDSIRAYGVIHTGPAGAAVEPTCTEPGWTAGIVCEVCGQAAQRESVPALGHDYEVVVTPPADGFLGYSTYTCTRCGHSYVGDYSFENSIASGECGNGVYWTVTDDMRLLIVGEGDMPSYNGRVLPWSDYRGYFDTVVIQDGITSVSAYAFFHCENIDSVVLGASVRTIGEYAFSNCNNLETVEVSENLESIADWAFAFCYSLTEFDIPASVTFIGERVFLDCSQLSAIHVSEDNASYSSDAHGVLFDKEKTTLIYAPGGISDIYQIPAGVTTIGPWAFQGCYALPGVVISGSVVSIERYAFSDCYSLNNITIPASVEWIDEGAFDDCVNLSQVYFMGDAVEFGYDVFPGVEANCYYPGGNTTWTDEVMQGCGGWITWIPMGEIVGIELIAEPNTSYAVGEELDLTGMQVVGVDSYGNRMALDHTAFTIGECDMSTVGVKNVTISYGGSSLTLQIYVHAGRIDQVLDPATYPESGHNYLGYTDEVQTITCPGASYLTLVFSDSTFTEWSYDYIYVYDRNDNRIADYTGDQAAGVTLTVPGDTAKIRLITDGSVNYYGYSFTSIRAYGVIHTGPEGTPVDPTCTEPGRTAGLICEVCGEHANYEMTPALGHDYAVVKTPATPDFFGYSTHTCTRCGDSYVDDYCAYGAIDSGMCGDTLYWSVTDENALVIFGEGEMDWYDDHYDTPWWQYREKLVSVVITEGVTAIGPYAFAYLEKVTNIDIADSVVSIREDAFAFCESLTSLHLSANVLYITEQAFRGCASLTGIYVEEGNPHFSSDAFGVLFNEDKTYLHQAPGGLSGVYEIPDTVEGIGHGAFYQVANMTEVTVPDSVTFIGQQAFYGCNGLKSVTLPGSVVDLYGSTFYRCENLERVVFQEGFPSVSSSMFAHCGRLTDVTLPDSIDMISPSAFEGCTSLEEITLPDNIWSIGYDAFSGCKNLRMIEIPASVSNMGSEIFRGCRRLHMVAFAGSAPDMYSDVFAGINATIYYPAGDDSWDEVDMAEFDGDLIWTPYSSADEIVMPEASIVASGSCGENLTWSLDSFGVLKISGQGAMTDYEEEDSDYYYYSTAPWMAYSNDIYEVVIESGVTTIGDYAFSDSSYLEDVKIADTVLSIGMNAFQNCGNLGELTIPASVTYIYCGRYAFGYGTRIVVDENNVCYSSDESGVLFDKEKHTLLYVPQGLSGEYAIPDGVTTLPDLIFEDCEYLTGVIIPSSVTDIGNGVFHGCSELYRIQVAEGSTSYRNDAMGVLYDMDMKTLVKAPVGLEGNYVIPASVTVIGDSAFYYCGGLVDVTIPDGVEIIGTYAFFGCYDLRTITIPDSVTEIGFYAFAWCDDAEQLTIGNGITKIGSNAFKGCRSLTEVTIPDCITEISKGMFSECWNLERVHTGSGVTTIDGSAFSNCYSLTEVTIPKCVTSIGDRAFSECYYLTSIYFCGNAPEMGYDVFASVEATAYYPAGDPTWTSDVMQNYGGEITWVPYEVEDDGEEEPEDPIVITSQPVDFVGVVGEMGSFTVNAEGEGLTYQWEFSQDGGNTWQKISTSNSISVEFKANRLSYLYRCVITDAEGNTVTTDVVRLIPAEVDIVIQTQPVSYVGAVNDDVTFTVEATGNGVTYQWYYSTDGGANWAPSGSPGNATATLRPILRAYRDGYQFFCRVTDILGNSVDSDVVSMTVKAGEIIITEQPQNVVNAVLGQLYYFNVAAEGDNLEYRWQISSDGGETWQESWNQGYNTTTLGVRMNANRDGNMYRCAITSGLKVVAYTDAVVLDLQDASAQIVSQSGNVFVTVNKTATFTVEAEGMDLTYQWYRSNDKGATWNLTYLSGYNTNTLSFVGTAARTAMYMCRVTDGSGTVVWSSPVKLQILSAELKILTQPVDVTCAAGETATFTVEAQGDSLKYQWYASSDGGATWTPSYLTGYNTSEFSFAVNENRAAKLYKCIITDAAGNTVETDVVKVTIEKAVL